MLKLPFFRTAFFVMAIMVVSGFSAMAYDLVENTEMFNGHGPDFDMDQQGNLHMVWQDGKVVRYLFGERQGDGTIEFWPVENNIEVPGSGTSSPFRYGFPKIACDIDGGLHITWVSSTLRELFYACYRDGSFPFTGKIKSTYPKYLGNSDIEVDTQGRAYIAYQNPKLGPPYGMGVICYQVGVGQLWDRIMMPIDSGEEKYPALALNSYQPLGAQNPLYFFWKEVHQFAKYDGAGWTNAMDVPGVPQFNGRVDISVDPMNRPVLGYLNWITGEYWWIEGIYVMTCNDFGSSWNTPMKVSTAGEVIFRDDYSPTAPEVAVNASGDMMSTWNDNGILKYNVYENNRWMDEEKTLGYVNMHTCNGGPSTQFGDIFVMHENQGNRLFYNHFRFNQSPQVLMAGCVMETASIPGSTLGGEQNIVAIVQDPNGIEDMQAVRVLDPNMNILFNMYDDGQHGDFMPGDTIFGAEIPDQHVEPGERMLFYIVAEDTKGAISDVYPFMLFHSGGGAGAGMEPDHIQYQVPASSGGAANGDYEVFMGGYMNSRLVAGVDSILTIMAWVQPRSPMVSTSVDRVELLYDSVPVLQLPLVLEDPSFGQFYGLSIELPGDSIEGLDNVPLLFEMRAVDSRGRPGPVWPYLEVPNPPTPTPTPEPTSTPEPTVTPEPTETPRPTQPPFPY